MVNDLLLMYECYVLVVLIGQIYAKRQSIRFCLINPQFSTPYNRSRFDFFCSFFIQFNRNDGVCEFFLSLSHFLSWFHSDDLWLSFKCVTVNVGSLIYIVFSLVGVVDAITIMAAIYCCYFSMFWFGSLLAFFSFYSHSSFCIHTLCGKKKRSLTFIRSHNRRVFFTFYEIPSYFGIAVFL